MADYGVTTYLYLTLCLVDIMQEAKGRMLKCDYIQQGNAWRRMEMLIYNNWPWWTQTGKPRTAWLYYFAFLKGFHPRWFYVTRDMDRLGAFSKHLITWGPGMRFKIKLCRGATTKGSAYLARLPPAAAIVNRVLSTVKRPIYLLDVKTLSQLRKDAHPTKYGGIYSSIYCNHWCLPGLPNNWNQLLYAALLI
ncbi:protein trichome birefringence-like 37 [Olea europaea var. sylvestris]|uniref:protein trichome birefringence-like 37 n=1 Tax=Olea europaea var. sylvestris TaxID=158386 RepID=UPI000C1D7742|nr:protein trichome birefringence-like 37 [Olea europaea var. sylvestris]